MRPYLKLIIGTLILICVVLGLYFVINNSNKNQTSSSNNIQATSTENVIKENPSENDNVSDETEPKAPALDLTKLQGKDRLYTEEEGQYENLSEEEKKVLIEAYHCRNYEGKGKQACKQYAEIYGAEVEGVRLVALKDGVVVIYGPGGPEMKGRLYIYDIHNQNILGSFIDFWNTAYGISYLIRRGEINSALELYRPGMTSFVTIPDSELEDDLHYLEWKEMIIRDFPVTFNGDIITVTIFKYDCDGSVINGWSGMPETCTNIIKGTRTFDLSNLP